MSEKNLWNMGLLETYIIDGKSDLTRVPGGWIYGFGHEYGISTTFIPYHDEFKPDNKPELAAIKDKLFDPDKKASLAHGGIDNATPKDWDAVAKDLYGN